MAKAKNRAARNAERDNGVPEGFDINAARMRGEGWVKKEPGNAARGMLMGRVTYEGAKGKPRAFYQLRLTAPCVCVVGSDDEAEIKTLAEGAVVNADEIAGLIGLKAYAGNGGEYEVWFRYKSEPAVEGDPWIIDGPALKMHKAPVVGAGAQPVPF